MSVSTKGILFVIGMACSGNGTGSYMRVSEIARRCNLQPRATSTHIAEALKSIKPEGRTALFDAVAAAIRELRDEQNRRAIVALTDGEDTDSLRSYDEIKKEAIEAGIPIYFIAYNTGLKTQQRDIDRNSTFIRGQQQAQAASEADERMRPACWASVRKVAWNASSASCS